MTIAHHTGDVLDIVLQLPDASMDLVAHLATVPDLPGRPAPHLERLNPTVA